MKSATIGAAILVLAIAITALTIVAAPPAYADPDCNEPPTNLSAALNGDNSAVVVAWDAPADCTPDTYAVHRKVLDQDERLAKIGTVNGSTTTFTDQDLVAGKTHRYRIKSNDNPPRSAYAQVAVPQDEPEPTPEPTPTPTPAPGIDYEQERNDSVSLGDIANAAPENRDDTVDSDDPVDYFHFSLSEERTVGVRIRKLDYDADLYVEDDDGNVIASSENGGDRRELIDVTLAATDANKYYYVRVEAKEDGQNDYQFRYLTEAPPQPPNTAATGAPTITGTAQVRETLTASTAGIADDNGLSNATFTYQWVRNNGSTDTDISGATGSTYTLTTSDLAHTIRVEVSFSDDDGYFETVTSSATTTVIRPPNATASGQPTITGTVQVGETLTASTSGISDGNGSANAQFGYQWVRNNGGTDADSSGATGSTYTLTTSDLAHTIKVKVTFTDDDGYSETLISNATGTVLRPPNATASGQPTITGTVKVREMLRAETSGISDENGLSNPQYTFQWVHSVNGTDTDISDATGPATPLRHRMPGTPSR